MMCDGVPGPPVPELIGLPCERVQAISSFRSFAGTDGLVTMICGLAAIIATGSKSLKTS